MLARRIISEIKDQEAVVFAVKTENPHVPGVGIGFFVALGEFNAKNTLRIRISVRFPERNWFELVVEGEGADVLLSRAGVTELLEFFDPYYMDFYCKRELIQSMKDYGVWPEI